jgi:hypothetical protein
LTKHLADPAPEVRFWVAFTLDKLRAKQARVALVRLVADDTMVPRWWSVGDEATDALDRIAGREPPDRLFGTGDLSGIARTE